MKKLLNCIYACLPVLASLYSFPASAHEFWMWPQPFSAKAGTAVALTLNVGQYFEGDLIGFTASQAASLRHYSAAEIDDLTARIPGDRAIPAFGLRTEHPGTHLIAYDSRPSLITMSADKFHAYLHDEGLDSIIEQRTDAGKAELPGRERYRRCVKTLLRIGGKSDRTFAIKTGQRLEIIPLTNPQIGRAGSTLDFKLMFDDKPLVNSLIKAWHKHSGQTVVIRVRSNEDGRFSLSLPYAGPWMISVVHMIPASDNADVDWDSYWGNLSFEVGNGHS